MKKLAFIIIILASILCQSNVYAQNITTIAGTGVVGYNGDCIPASTAKLHNAPCIAIDASGNLFIGDAQNNRVRKVDVATGIITTIAGTGIAGFTGDSGLATAAQINLPDYLAFDIAGNLYFADAGNNRIRRIDAVTGIITNYACNGIVGPSPPDSVYADTVTMNVGPFAIDHAGNMYVNATYNISKIDPTGFMTTIAGTGDTGMILDSVPARSTPIGYTNGMATDKYGNLFFADGYGSIRKITMSTGIITRVAGSGVGIGPYTGDSILATNCYMNPLFIFVDSFGDIYAGLYSNMRVIMIDTLGYTHTVAGTGVEGFSGDGGPATDAKLNYPQDIALDPFGNLYISDWQNSRIRKVTYDTVNIAFSFSVSASPGDTVCTGTSVTYSVTASAPGIGGSYSYQWYVNGSPVIDTASTYTYTPSNGDSIFCICTSNPCSILDTSNVIHMVVTSATTPTITISASPGDTVCSGTPVTYTSTVTGGGTSLTYYWYVNGSPAVGGTSSSYSYTPANRDSVRCVCTGLSSCTSTLTTSSNTINMVVNPVITPTITISASPGDTVCTGTPVMYSSTITGGGASLTYHWYVNGSPAVGGTSSSYSYTPANGDSVRCVYTSASVCTGTVSASSNTINMVVQPYTTPTITVNAPVSAMLGSIVTVTATVAGAGSSYSIMWYDDGAWFATTTVPTTTYTKTHDVDTITATVASTSVGCWDSSTSNPFLVGDTSLGTLPNPPEGREVLLYPNPASGVITITSAENIMSVEVRNVYGQVVTSALRTITSPLPPSKGEYRVDMDISALPAGVYILCITQQPTPNPSEEGNIVMRKVVKE